MAGRELADVAKILTDFNIQHQDGDKPVFGRSLQFFLDEIKFESKIVIDGLDEDIAKLKREIDKTNELRIARIKSLEECAQKVTNVLID